MERCMKQSKKAFSMLELVFVIAILGIVASISSSVIVQVYESYIMQRAVHNASIDTELAINQITNRLTYRIDKSLLARRPGNTNLTDTAALPINEVAPADLDAYTALEWINYAHDSFSAYNPPAWSGFCDLNMSTLSYIETPGSKLTKLNTGSHALVFLGSADYRTDGGSYDDKRCMYSSNGCIFPVTNSGDTRLNFTAGDGNRSNTGVMLYTEYYQLAKTAYAVVPEHDPHYTKINNIDVWDLKLYSNYQPWDDEDYKDGLEKTLIKDISVFRFKKEANSIRVKLCKVVPIGDSSQVTICKEKAVIR